MRKMLAVLGGVALAAGSISTTAGATVSRSGDQERIVIATIGVFEESATGFSAPELPAAVRARVKAINKAGGIGGRKIDVFECNGGFEPNKEEACVRDAIERDVAAVIGLQSQSPTGLELLEEAGIPSVGPVAATPPDYLSPVSFPLTSGIIGQVAGLPIALSQEGAETQVAAYTDLGAAARGVFQLVLDNAAEQQGIEFSEPVVVPADQTDLGPTVAAVTADDPSGVLFIFPGSSAKFIQQIDTSGFEGDLAAPGVVVSPDVIDEVGKAANGLLLVDGVRWQNTKNGKLYQREMKKHAKGETVTGSAAVYWLATWVFGEVAAQIDADGGTVDAGSMLAAMGGLTEFDTRGMTPPLTTTQPAAIDFPIPLSQLFNPTVVIYQVKKGKVVELDGDFVNPFAPA